jgi:hypothetical protein
MKTQNETALNLLRKISRSPVGIWRREALRLFNEFQRTRNVRHLKAFIRHCRGIEARLGSPLAPLALPK